MQTDNPQLDNISRSAVWLHLSRFELHDSHELRISPDVKRTQIDADRQEIL